MTDPWNLTPREADVLGSLAETGNAKLTGRALGISEKTVYSFLHRAMPRMGVRNLMQAVLAWDRWLRRMELPALPEAERQRTNNILLWNLYQQQERKAA